MILFQMEKKWQYKTRMKLNNFPLLPRLALCLAIVFFTELSNADNRALIIGGGCEPVDEHHKCHDANNLCDANGPSKGSYNGFRPLFELANQSLSQNGWKTTLQYDSSEWDHPWKNSTQSSRQILFDKLDEEIKSFSSDGKNEFLIGIATHGSYLNHSICLGDGSLLPITELIPYIDRLKKKNVKVAVIDSSCYSGQTLEALKSTGACLISSTNPNTTSAGDAIWAGIFGLGMKRNQQIPSFHTKSFPESSGDLNEDHRISAAEAFAFASLHDHGPMVPRISDCSLEDAEIKNIFDSVVPFLRTEYSLKPEIPANFTEALPVLCDKCQLENLPDAFKAITAGLDATMLLKFKRDLKTLGYSDGIDNPEQMKKSLINAISKLQKAIKDTEKDSDLIDRIIAHNIELPKDEELRLFNKLVNLNDCKKNVFLALRPLIHMACLSKKSSSNHCQSFDLFPSRQ